MYILVQKDQNGYDSVLRPKIGILEKYYLRSEWTPDPNIWMVVGKGGDLFACRRILGF